MGLANYKSPINPEAEEVRDSKHERINGKSCVARKCGQPLVAEGSLQVNPVSAQKPQSANGKS